MDAAMWANVIAGLALLIAITSAVFSWKSAVATKHANRLVLHSYQKELYDSFTDSYRYLRLKEDGAESHQFLQFGGAVSTAKLYVSNGLAEKLIKFHDLCFGIEELARRVSHTLDEQNFINNLPDSDAVQKADKERKIYSVKLRLHSNIGARISAVTVAKEIGRLIDKEFEEELKIL